MNKSNLPEDHLSQDQLTQIYRDWVISPETRNDLSAHYLLYWDRIYFNNYIPYFTYPQTYPRISSHNGLLYHVHTFESYPGEWEKGEEQSSRVSLSFRSWKESSGERRGVVLVKAAIYREII